MKNAITKESTMTTKEVAKALGVDARTITRAAKRYLPNKKIENGKRTFWTEEEISVLLNEMKRNGYGSGTRNDLTSTEVVQVTETSKSYELRLQSVVEQAKSESDLQAVARAGMIALQTMLESSQRKIIDLRVRLDESKEWASVKLMEKLNPTRKFDWRVLKRFSTENGIEIKKATDQNYGEVNSYHKTVWESCYELDETPWK